MNHPSLRGALFMALAILASGCSEREQERPPAPAAAVQATMPKECDMAGMDMSKMSAEEHQKMLDDCEKAKARK